MTTDAAYLEMLARRKAEKAALRKKSAEKSKAHKVAREERSAFVAAQVGPFFCDCGCGTQVVQFGARCDACWESHKQQDNAWREQKATKGF